MTPTPRAARPDHRRCGDDQGTALVEFTFVAVLLLTIVFAIINLGLILSFKQDMTRAAAEGARAAAVSFPATDAVTDATTATEQAVQGFNKSCTGGGGLTCLVRQHDCAGSVPDTNGDDPLDPNCVQVELIYDYEDHPLLVPVPLIAAFLPDEIRAKSDARVNE
jgi:Flp pilus assembly protein TadG